MYIYGAERLALSRGKLDSIWVLKSESVLITMLMHLLGLDGGKQIEMWRLVNLNLADSLIYSEPSLQRTIVYRCLVRYEARFVMVGVCIRAYTVLIHRYTWLAPTASTDKDLALLCTSGGDYSL